jgi:hypothetical protein
MLMTTTDPTKAERQAQRKREAAERSRDWAMLCEGIIDIHEFKWPWPRKRQKRKPSLTKIVRAARKAGVASVTLPDGTRLDLGAAPSTVEANNPWLAELKKAANQ